MLAEDEVVAFLAEGIRAGDLDRIASGIVVAAVDSFALGNMAVAAVR